MGQLHCGPIIPERAGAQHILNDYPRRYWLPQISGVIELAVSEETLTKEERDQMTKPDTRKADALIDEAQALTTAAQLAVRNENWAQAREMFAAAKATRRIASQAYLDAWMSWMSPTR